MDGTRSRTVRTAWSDATVAVLRAGSIKSWSDKQISPGSPWLTEIKTALTNTKVAVLLVTPDFIASDFIHEYELGPFLKEAKQGSSFPRLPFIR